ncbi:MAG: hypothetical protein ACLVHS_11155 [Blautia wexlerae]
MIVVQGTITSHTEEAEILKTDRSKEAEIFPVIKATRVEKMATITQKFLTGYQVPAVYVVGGSASLEDFTGVFEKSLGYLFIVSTSSAGDPTGYRLSCDLPPVTHKNNQNFS